ncbi:AbrB/MazE/SpoVT family DNA-binding domain-containing protein [Sphingobium sp. Z007]|uniref:AbrB/MazE/SpoVT family DNA-binding domain-containing protein n=1 Tax=Sphingobium sp. Z007 TaxID=627495 RepID=UPI000B49B251
MSHSSDIKLIVNRDNRVTLPAALRRKLGLRPGDAVELVVRDGGLIILPVTRTPISDPLNGTVRDA